MKRLLSLSLLALVWFSSRHAIYGAGGTVPTVNSNSLRGASLRDAKFFRTAADGSPVKEWPKFTYTDAGGNNEYVLESPNVPGAWLFKENILTGGTAAEAHFPSDLAHGAITHWLMGTNQPGGTFPAGIYPRVTWEMGDNEWTWRLYPTKFCFQNVNLPSAEITLLSYESGSTGIFGDQNQSVEYRGGTITMTGHEGGTTIDSVADGTLRIRQNSVDVIYSDVSEVRLGDVAKQLTIKARDSSAPLLVLNNETVNLGGVLWTQTGTRVVTNTTSATTLLTGTGDTNVSANFLIAGRTLRFDFRGRYSTAGTPGTFTVDVAIGSTVVFTTGAITPPATQTEKYFELNGVLTCRTAGAGGTVMGCGNLELQSATSTAAIFPMLNATTTTINTTTNNDVHVRLTMSATTAPNNMQVQVGNIWVQ